MVLHRLPLFILFFILAVFVLAESSLALSVQSITGVFDMNILSLWTESLLQAFIIGITISPYLLILLPILVFALASVKKERVIHHVSQELKNEATHFMVFVPAFNEQEVILNSVRSLLAQNYPADKFKLLVVFNGTDHTGDIAKEAGATVLVTPQSGIGKRPAISYALEQLKPDPNRYILVIDADNYVDPDFLLQMDQGIRANKAIAVQGNHQPLIVGKNWISHGLSAAYRASSLLYNEGRSLLLGSALICGTGFAIREDVLRHLWPKIKTLTEDIEMNGLLQWHYGCGVLWIKKSFFYDEKPDNLSIAIKQRTRWMVGHFWCGLLYSPRLIINGIKTRNLRMLEIGLYYLFPFVLLSSVITLCLTLTTFFVHSASFIHIGKQVQLTLSLGLILIYMLYVLIGDSLSTGYRQTPRTFKRYFLDSFYGLIFALAVWPIAIVRACFMMQRSDWIFHTPHKSTNYEQT